MAAPASVISIITFAPPQTPSRATLAVGMGALVVLDPLLAPSSVTIEIF
jgi:hypothetical protein